MATTEDINVLKINYLTRSQYDTAKTGNNINDDELYVLTDSGMGAQTSAPSTTDYATANLKNIVLSSEAASNASDYPSGAVWMRYGTELSLLNFFYPVGSYYETSDGSFNPNTAWGGTWELETPGQVHVSAGTGYNTGATGGATTVSYTPAGTIDSKTVSISGTSGSHTLTTSEIPAHKHIAVIGNSGDMSDYLGGSTAAYGCYAGDSGKSGTKYYTNSVGSGGGHTHSFSGSASHNHTFTGTAKSISTMQPYIVVNRWHRTA